MPQNGDSAVSIRKYRPEDRPAVRRICCLTAMVGEPSAAFFDDDEVFADALTSYYTDREPESCFVAERGREVVGYLIGSKDARAMGRAFAGALAAPLVAKSFARGTFFRRKNAAFLSRVIMSLAKGEFGAPDFSEYYPATLHINIVDVFRAAGIGSRLVRAYLEYLKSEGVSGVHFATMSEGAGRFFAGLGFRRLFEGRRSYFRHILGKDVPLYIYGMRLAPGLDPEKAC
jgi:predicted N-acetyltransferase YhbS